MRLDDVRVIDLSHLLPGPYATQLLADAGAEVVKVEPIDGGDAGRAFEPRTPRGVGSIFELVNRGKRSVAIDLKHEDGRDAFYELVSESDVVFEQFRPGVVDRLEIDYETLTEYNDELVYCSLTGYGQDGPWADRAGHDLNYVGLSGLLDMTRDLSDSKPQIPGYPVADMAGGLCGAFAVVGALLSRELGPGDGEYVDLAMADVVASFSQAVTYQAATGDPATPRPGETPLTGELPWYDVYETADGRWVTLAALEPKFWRAFCEATDREELISAHGSRDPDVREALRAELEELFADRTLEEWERTLAGVDATVAGVYRPDETLEHPQFDARDLVVRPDGLSPRVVSPVADGAPAHDESIPELGEHTRQYLAAVGYDDAEIDALYESDVVG